MKTYSVSYVTGAGNYASRLVSAASPASAVAQIPKHFRVVGVSQKDS
jgi:hypothetical protein